MQLRKFSAYDKTAAQSVFSVPCTLIQLDGNYTGGGGEYLQIFDKATAAAANDVPIASFVLSAAGPLPSIFGVLGAVPLANGLSIGISTANEKYTASSSGFDIFGGVSEMELPQSATVTTYGPQDLSGVAGYWEVFDTGTPKRLYRVVFTNGAPAATKTWLVICAEASAGTYIAPLKFVPLFTTANSDGTGTVTNRASGILSFGEGGLIIAGTVQSVDALSYSGSTLFSNINGLGFFVTDTANPASKLPSTLSTRATDTTLLTAYTIP